MEFYGGYLLAGLNFAFPMDDPYIHLAMGKNLALHGNWGPMAGVFNSSSSSLLYTLIISVFFFLGLGGISTLFIINIVSSIGCLFAFEKAIRALDFNPDRYIILVFAFVLIVPLYHIAFLSMEHTLHIWLILLAITRAAKYFANEDNNTKLTISLSIVTSLATMARYETLFFAFIVGLLLLYRKQFKNAFIFGIITLLPIAIFGYISVMNGESFLPNSVLIKGIRSGDTNWVYYAKYLVRWAKNMIEFPDYGVSLLLVISVVIWKLKDKKYDFAYWFSFIALFVIVLHGSFAKIGWLARYEAYLIAIALVSLTFLYDKFSTNRKTKFIPFLIIAIFVLLRTFPNTFDYRYGMQNIYNQQYQMSQFIKEYYNESEIVINDIGTTSYYTNAKYIDVWGLADYDIVEYKLKNGFIDQDLVSRLSYDRNSQIAIIYNENSFHYVPSEWKKVASWTIKNRQVSNFATIYFYAINESEATLKQQVANFSSHIPSEISVEYYKEEQ
ncbi:MAG: hypothetical protein CVV25_12885 [Ignavibacteriae bacterium HGW-Ignavibacteriae-4]|jgi:hypothetical protein|nr:MAG: hypothetical protein CVV25_12885 [Ignavibacteriae bacterium HGW-Ignavibacteriae-4]